MHAFEPQPELITNLYMIKNWLNYENITLSQTALSNESGFKILGRVNVGDGSATLESDNKHYTDGDKIEVQTITLEDYVINKKITQIDYLKIDVEGHELAVIQGGIKVLQEFKPIVQVELRVKEDSSVAVIEHLSNIGYSGKMLCDGLEFNLSEYKNYKSKKFGDSGHRDFFFEPN